MKGTHTVIVERAKVKYTLTFKRNISFIRGNSGTGKTTLISMICDYNDRGQESGVTLSCDVPCETLPADVGSASCRSSKIQSSF